MTYTVVINKREIPVPYKVYLAHCTQQFKALQPMSVYNKFLSTYRLPKKDIIPFMRTYLDKRASLIDTAISHAKTLTLIKEKIPSPLFLATAAEYFCKVDYSTSVGYAATMTKIVQKHINFCDREYSEAYEKLQPLSAFYHEFVYRLDFSLPVYYPNRQRRFVFPKKIISIDDLREAIKVTNRDVTLEDVRKDIDNHGVLLDLEDHFVWGSEAIRRWYWSAGYNKISLLNFNKLLSMHIYN